MKSPLILSAIAAAMAIPTGAANSMELRYENEYSNTLLAPTGKTRARFASRAGGNQRQRRKDRRRLHAAGSKKAFLG